jgi:hypothetical protein
MSSLARRGALTATGGQGGVAQKNARVLRGQPKGFDWRRAREEALQRLADIEQMQRLTNDA